MNSAKRRPHGIRGILGILVSERRPSRNDGRERPSGMPEDTFCRRLCLQAEESGLDAFVFDAESVLSAEANGSLQGWRLHRGAWRTESAPPPELIYDRSMCRNPAERERRSSALASLSGLNRFVLLGGSLPGKPDVNAALQDDEAVRPYLPPTFRLGEGPPLETLAGRWPEGLFLKPAAGMQGRGALSAREDGGRIAVLGRDRANRPLDREFAHWPAAVRWLKRFAGGSEYIVQPLLRLTSGGGLAFDVRALVQKDGRGRWAFTGAAVREGAPGSVTSNLHGGGKAYPAGTRLALLFGEEQAAKLLARIRRTGERAAAVLERRFGRLTELGFDFGIEPDGRIWLLEANAKPGREAFEADPHLSRLAVRRPIQYAAMLLSRRGPVFPAAIKLSTDSNAATRNLQMPESKRRYVQEVLP
ncbi:YheC/YheD family protein [Paenibacillus humicola]|uniref:YheC/YheD family endospore coat-associated protein n=1 Tax=Paenibacillus humicola TaxID=3110540 RepID=UPI00237C2CD4|nr:YheC/YheD family protein [Paenibacillus humicola]